MNCVFICIFNQEKYVEMSYLLLDSIFRYGNLENTHILIYTSFLFMEMIKQSPFFLENNDKIIFSINDIYNDVDSACKSRLDLFKLPMIANYNKILYLDTDIIIKGDLNIVFDLAQEDILYVLEEGNLCDNDHWYGGQTLFGGEIVNYEDKSAFTSGILLFKRCEKIKSLFNAIITDIHIRPHPFSCYDQPYIVYNAFKHGCFNNKILKQYVVNNDHNPQSDKIIHHFPGNPGVYIHKLVAMTDFLKNMKDSMQHIGVNSMLLIDSHIPPQKNTSLPLVAVCVSYDYFDTLQFTLPVNYLHFDQIYLITQEDDVQTVEFCKKFDNVCVLFYDFKNNGKTFDKFGALNYGQQRMYEEFPNSWYLIIDSDIVLPNNFIDVISKESLNAECLYGAIRNNVFKTSEFLDKTAIITNKDNANWLYNNILWQNNTPPSILGCFQLYKKKYIYHQNLKAGYGDYLFGHDNFDIFCNLENVLYFHLGQNGVNWDGKVVSFIDDIHISLSNIYYEYNKVCNNKYYDKLSDIFNTLHIEDDIWTCSDKMRRDIYDFFKDKSHFKIAEIGSHKGYSTKVLARIFSKVYAVDNSIEWTAFNKNFNKNSNNIEYVMLDIYKNSWEILPEDIEVSFIDADHSYNGCKSDILNSIKQFKNLQYIILDDYGVWAGVKKIVDELIESNILKLETFIGITDVPSLTGVINGVNEGVICSIVHKITPVLFQINKIAPEQYILDMIEDKLGDNWRYEFYDDNAILEFFKNNSCNEFPNIIEKYNTTKHKECLFQYYYLYLKGGFFMDSDTMIYENIENIVQNFEFIYCHLNIILGASPKNEIIKKAIESDILLDEYSCCNQLYKKIYSEFWSDGILNEYNAILNGDTIIFKHFCKNKTIPDVFTECNKEEEFYFDNSVLITFDTPTDLMKIDNHIIADGLNYDLFISCGDSKFEDKFLDSKFEDKFLDKYTDIRCISFYGTISNFPNHRNDIEWINKNIGYLNTSKMTNLKKYIVNYNNVFLKMNINGVEFNWIDSMSEDELNKFSQMVIKVHCPFNNYRCNMLKKINKTHSLIFLNNIYINEAQIPEVFEATYIRKK